jgi:hypothetical protein
VTTISAELAETAEQYFSAGSAGSAVSALNVDGNNYEGQGIGQTDLRQVQDRPPPRRGAGDLLESETQAAAGIGNIWRE